MRSRLASGGHTQVLALDPLAEPREQLAAKNEHQHPRGQKVAAPRLDPGALSAQAPVGHPHVHVRVQRKRASPSVQRRQIGGRCTQVLRIGEQLRERLAHRGEQQLRHRGAVAAPQRVQLVRDGEDQVMVRARQEPRALALKPPLDRQPLALRTDALVTGVVERPFDVPLRAAAHVATELRRAAPSDPVRGAMHVRRQPVALGVRLEMLPEDPAQRAFHVLRNARRAFSSTSRRFAALLPRRSRARATSRLTRRPLAGGRS